jgi:hypothetical protein
VTELRLLVENQLLELLDLVSTRSTLP